MKKVLLIAVFAICGLGTANAQGFSGGANIGLPVGDASNTSSLSFGVDLLYMFNADEEFTYGIATGYQNYVGKTVGGISIPSSNFIPLAAAGRYAMSDQFSVGADVGYAIAEGGGFYYRPMLVYNLNDTMKINASYSGVAAKGGGTLANFGVGLMYDF